MAEAESDKAARLQDKASEMLKSPRLSIVLPASEEPKSSYFLTKSLPEMVNEGPMTLQNQSCVIHGEIGKTLNHEQPVYSSSARLPTFSIGLSSTQGINPPRAPLRESSVDPKDKSPPRYFQMPELGARVFVGDVDGVDTIACHVFNGLYEAIEFDLDIEHAIIRSLYTGDHPGGLSGWLRAQATEPWGSELLPEVILSGTELFRVPIFGGRVEVGNLRGKSSSVSGSSSDNKDCTRDETIRQPSDIVEQPEDPVPCVYCSWADHWKSVEEPHLQRSTKGSYLKKPKFMKRDEEDLSYYRLHEGVLHLTRFDDFVILGNAQFEDFSHPGQAINIVRKNAFETADVIAAQLVKSVMKGSRPSRLHPITAIVILLDHKEILLREQKKENVAPKHIALFSGFLGPKPILQSLVLRDAKVIVELKKKEKITTLKEEEKVFASKIKDKKGIMLEEDHKVKILVDEPLRNIPQISIVSLEEIELGMKSTTISSNLTSAEVQDDSKVPSSVVLIEGDGSKREDFMVSHHITKWIICGDLLERTLLCFFNIEEMQYEFYFEDHESMATIIGLGVPHSKVILECGSPHVIVVEILEEDWDVVWDHSNDIPPSIPEGNVLKQEMFPNILHCIANIINKDNIVSKANDGVGGDNGKGKAKDNADDSKGKGKGKAHDHDNHGNTSHLNCGSNGDSDDNDKKEKKEKDGNNDKKDGRDRDDGKISNDCKEVQAVVHLRLLPGGVLEEKKKKKELGEGHEEEGEGKENKLGEVHDEERMGKKKELGEIHEDKGEETKTKVGEVHEEEGEEKKKEGEGCKRVEKKKKKYLVALWHALKGGENGNVVKNQQKWTTTKGIEDGDADENLKNQLEKQIHSHIVFTFTIKDEAGGLLKTIQATIDPITFQFPPLNEENYMQRKRFGWFHEKLEVAFGVVNIQAADLVENSCKVLDSSEAKEINLQGYSKGNARTTTNAYKGEMGIQYGVKASGVYGRTNGLEAKTTEDNHNSWETNKTLTKGGFSISERSNLNSQQLKFSYFPRFPFNEKEFKAKDKVKRLKMYENPICQLQRVSCEGTWQPYDSEKLEAYKLEVSRDVGMTRIYNVDLETGEESNQKGVWKVGKNLPLCFIQTLEKVVFMNHAMSHLTSSTAGVYRLKEQHGLIDPSTTFVTQAQIKKDPNWPGNDRLVDVKE